MSFAFLHPEFFFWMVPPAALLFYFWQTQKPLEGRWLGEEVLKKLRAPETTMGLKARNWLFLAASLLLIGAMAQPVAIDSDGAFRPGADVVIAVDTINAEALERTKALCSEAIGRLAGEEIGIVALDARLCRVAPLTTDTAVLTHLVRHLQPASDPGDIASMLQTLARYGKADVVIIASESSGVPPSAPFMKLEERADIGSIEERIARIKESKRQKSHIPLFYYPLGLAMFLIWISLSSMSSRRSVVLTALIAMLGLGEAPSEAGWFDFKLLEGAKRAYEAGEYARSAELYGEYQRSHDSPGVRYNRANALYKAGRYGQAEYWYRRVYTDDPVLEARRRFNLGQTRREIARQRPGETKNGPEKRGASLKTREKSGEKGEGGGFKTRLYPFG